jgi:antitoxin (DNA-binding transcriptional repressor) of toxin-antitoxin stability system
MRSVGIRIAKARLSELARAAANGEATMLTDYGKPIAVISPSGRRPRQRAVLTQGNSGRPCSPSPIIWIWVSRATEESAREECVEHLAYRYPLVRDPRAFGTKVGSSTLAGHAS